MTSLRRTRASPGEGGFTLIELIVSLTALALLTAAIGFAVRFGLQAWDRTQKNAGAAEEIERARALLAREIAAAYPLVTGSGPAGTRVDFVGHAGQMEFLARAPEALARAGRARIKFAAVNSGGSRMLQISARPELAPSTKLWQTEDLIEGLRTLEISYFGAPRLGDVASWQSTWTNSMRLPTLVRIHATFEDGRAWPELVIATHIEGDAGCRLDPLTHDCRGR